MISSLVHQEWLAVGRKYKTRSFFSISGQQEDWKLAIFSTNEAFENKVTTGMEEDFQKESVLWCLLFIQDEREQHI